MRNGSKGAWLVWGAALTGVLAAGITGWVSRDLIGAPASSPRFNVDDTPIERDAAHSSFASVIDEVAPSVVNVYSTRIVEQSPMAPLLEDPFFRRFFGEPEAPSKRRKQSLGSGVIVTKDGYILTNRHVIQNADEIEVALSNSDRQLNAEVVGTDPQTDLAVIKIDGNGFQPVTIADSDQLRVGDTVLAIGNPFGVGQSVTSGIVSALNRGFERPILPYQRFIQTDAAINPGNSGGALVDSKGRLVGINTFIISQTRGNQGLGFAIPINLARSVMQQIIEHGEVSRGYLGIMPQDIDSQLADQFGLSSPGGALVTQVYPDTPAAAAGLQEGDAIVAIDGEPVEDSNDLRFTIAEKSPGSSVDLTVVRDGEEMEIAVELGRRPDQVAQQGGPGGEPAPQSEILPGVELGDLSPRMRQQFNIPSDVEGALVQDVSVESPAYEAGLRPGAVILGINRQPVRSAQDAMRLSRKIEGDRLLLRVWIEGATRFMVVNVSRR